ncbi:GD22149 [Drosophila simulans]|uniref:GD22149 n=1 Tax=Drosophila simulans TaxID=7240 RepID=B4Q3A8_DROSI|nr:GD22149 [Drosophila simulans]
MSNLNLSNAPRRLAPGTATPVLSRAPVPGSSPAVPAAVPAVLTARLTSDNTVASGVASQQVLHHQVSSERHPPSSCPDSPIRRVSSSLKNSALDFASRFFNKCKAATFTVDGATYTIGSISPVVDVYLYTLQSAEIALSTLPVWEIQARLQQKVLHDGISF